MHWNKAKKLFLLALILVASLSAMRVTAPNQMRSEFLLYKFKDVLAPVQLGLNWLGRQASYLISLPVHAVGAAERNRQLEEELSRLKGEIIQLNEYKKECERLAALLNYKQAAAGQYSLMAASVVARDPNNWFGTVTLNRGAGDGVRENMTVLVPEGLVGRVVSVSSSTCEVLLISDPRSGVSATVQETRTPGILEGITGGGGKTRMIHIANDAPVETGQAVVTSGLGSVFPKGLPVGAVESVQNEPSGMFKTAVVRPFAPLNRLEEVFIVTGLTAGR